MHNTKKKQSCLFVIQLLLFSSYAVRAQQVSPKPIVNTPQIIRLELSLGNGQYYQVIKMGEAAPRILCRIITQGQGTLTGVWKLDDQIILPLQLPVSGYQVLRLPQSKLPTLPANNSGIHVVTLQFNDHGSAIPQIVLRYFISIETPLKAVSPQAGQEIHQGQDIPLQWSAVKGEYQYQVAYSQIPFQFLNDAQIIWHEPISNPEWILNTDAFSLDHVYWMVRAVSSTGRVVSSSEINYFLLSKTPKQAEEVNK